MQKQLVAKATSRPGYLTKFLLQDYDERSCYNLAKDLENPNMVLHLENLIKRSRRKKDIENDLSGSMSSNSSQNSPRGNGNFKHRKNRNETQM